MTSSTSTASITYSIQDYLKCIYELSAGGEPATTNAIAARLGVAPASVTGMIQKMAAAEPALVSYRKHQGVRLTEEGTRAALEVIRHHRLIETWLVESLGYSWDEVHEEAEKLEHAMSEDLERRIAKALGNPKRDPHGDPIPSADLVMPTDRSKRLLELPPGSSAIVRRIRPADGAALKHLRALGITIGARIKVLTISPYDEITTVQVEERERRVRLGPALTRQIFVEMNNLNAEGNH